ncbi:hypothetical protein KR026_004375, partial [Drosophila bipectinata]
SGDSKQVLSGIALLWASVQATTGPPATSTRPPNPISVRPRPRPRCLPVQALCTRSSPKVCGRTPSGHCQRFNSICELGLANLNRQPANVRHTRDIECRTVRGVGAAHRRRCWEPCPARPVVCKRTPPAREICVQSRNGRECKVLANNCQLRNQNCHSQPRNNWRRTDRRRCGQLQLGDKPQACVVLPRPTPRRPSPRPSPRP